MALKSAVYDYSLYTPDYYLKGFLAGGVCCSVTHGGATPIDFVKTRMQLVPVARRRPVIRRRGDGVLWNSSVTASPRAGAREQGPPRRDP